MAPPATLPRALREQLFRDGGAAWQTLREERSAEPYRALLPGDYPGAYEVLARLRPQADSFLELGSGVGVITIVAALLGYDACGIEVDPRLVDISEELARQFGARATFAAGSFIPEAFRDEADHHDEEFATLRDGADGYVELGRELADFDLVYAFHWPGLEPLFFELMRRHARQGALFLTFHGTEGYQLWRDGELVDER